MLLKFATAESARRAEEQRLRALISLPCVTRSGKKIGLFANIGGISGAEEAYRAGADGIGLFRSEFLFLGRDTLPSEEEQYQAYSRAARIMKDRDGPVVVRMLDAGSDKVVSALAGEKEENPALGVRGIRLLLSHPDVLRAQLRALCRASAHGKIAVMLPMVVSVKELLYVRGIFEAVRRELEGEGVPIAQRIPLGVMIETPAAAIMARELAAEADFFSVGTNDLCQYTLAADRQNSALAYLSEGEADLECVFRLIKNAADAIHSVGGGKWIGVCGELAADTALTARFLECGADELSVSPPFLLKLKEKIRLTD
jgi:phosphotransferase system enzyme I (PtsI)